MWKFFTTIVHHKIQLEGEMGLKIKPEPLLPLPESRVQFEVDTDQELFEIQSIQNL